MVCLDLRLVYMTVVTACRLQPHHHHGPASEGDPGLLQLSCRQPTCFTIPYPVYSGKGLCCSLSDKSVSIPNV